MKGTSKVIFGATLVMVVSLAMVLGLVLVLLAELYCSLLLRRRKHKTTKNPTTTTASASQAQGNAVPSPLSSFYSQGVLDAPRSYLFPRLPSKREKLVDDIEKQQSRKFHHFLNIQPQETCSSPAHQTSIVSSSSSSPSPCFITVSKPRPSTTAAEEIREEIRQDGASTSHDQVCYGASSTCHDKVCYVTASTTANTARQNFVYISNPIYDNEAGTRRPSSHADTPFETPDTSPSRLESGGSGSSDDDDDNGGGNTEEKGSRAKKGVSNDASSSTVTPPLTPVKDVPANARSVELKDVSRSLGTSAGSDNSNTNSTRNCASSSSSGSPATSPSW